MADASNNPLLTPPKLPHGAPPLDSVKPEHFMPAVKATIALAEKNIAAIKKIPVEKAGFENVIEALEFSGQDLSRVSSIFDNIAGANSSDAIRDIEEDINVEKVKYYNNVMLDADLFARVKAVHDKKASLSLAGEQARLLDETYKSFVRSGALLSPAEKEELRTIDERLEALSTSFKNNRLEAVQEYKKIITDEKELRGMPERAMKNYAEAAKKEGLDGQWLIRLSPPPMDIFMNCENRALREEIFRANTNAAYKDKHDNSPVVMETVKLRHRRAQMLGFSSHAAFVLDDRMAHDPETVMDFLRKNEAVYRPAAEEHLKTIKDYAQKTDGLTDFKQWDFLYYERRLQEETFKINLEDLRPYFELGRVLDGLRRHAEKLFNIEMKDKTGEYPGCHPDVKVYEVYDKKDHALLGLFYADYYARPGAKSGGAWMGTYRNRGIEDGENKPALVNNTCNFDPPAKDQPTLLSVDEVRTVYHEFGHGLHALLAKGDYASITGTNVKWDFVELPSQLMENWVREKEVLDTFAVHYKTGQKLSPEIVQKIKDMDNFGVGYAGLRQTYQALLDMKWHMTDPATIKSVEELEDGVIAESWLFPRAAGPLSTSFSHLFSGGYSAGYYSYKWAEVLEADVFEVFQKKGLYHDASAQLLGKTIYAQGGTRDPMDLFVDMMGRKPDPDALFRREGLLPANKNDECKKSSYKTGGKPKP